MSVNIAYGTETFVLFGDITVVEACNLARDMARVDAVSVFETLDNKPSFVDEVDAMQASTIFRSAERMRSLAMNTLIRYGMCFQAGGAYHIFKVEYTHAFFGHFMSLLYSKSLGNRGL